MSEHDYINREHPFSHPQAGNHVLPKKKREELLSYSHDGIGNLREDKHLGLNERFSHFINSPNALNILIDDVEQAVEAFQQTGTGT